jgi:hypothetical protein
MLAHILVEICEILLNSDTFLAAIGNDGKEEMEGYELYAIENLIS